MSISYGTGRRKNAIAKVWVKPGTGKITVNNKDVREYFPRGAHVDHLVAPLEAVGMTGKMDVKVTTLGGGKTGQSGAIRMGISRALGVRDEAMKVILAKGGFMTRDDRMVERKKYGRAKARASFQFSKR